MEVVMSHRSSEIQGPVGVASIRSGKGDYREDERQKTQRELDLVGRVRADEIRHRLAEDRYFDRHHK